MEIGILTAFLGGVISFLSPCVLPLAPPYLAYLGGTTLDQIAGDDGPVDARVARRVFLAACCFVLGLGTVFVALGAGASVAGLSILQWKRELAVVSGIALYAMGLHFVGLRRGPAVLAGVVVLVAGLGALGGGALAALRAHAWPLAALGAITVAVRAMGIDKFALLNREARFEGPARAGSYGTSYVIGAAFAFGWTPCIGPILGAILTLAAQSGSVAAGTGLLAVYALGLGLPFLVAALFVRPFLVWARGFRRHLATVEAAMGALLIAVGLMMMTGEFERLAFWLLETFPVLGRIG